MTGEEVRLSIVIPAHNAAATIVRCLNSIADQGLGGVEVIVVDDASHDETATAASRSRHVPTTVVSLPTNEGVSAARNQGVARARGSHVAFVDADDVLLPDSLAGFLEFALASDAEITISDFVMRKGIDEVACANVNSSRKLFSADEASAFQWLCLARVGFGRKMNVGLLGAPWAKIYRRDFLLRTFGTHDVFAVPVRRGQDVLMNVEAFGKATRIAYYPKVTYAYHVSHHSSSHKANPTFLIHVRCLIEHLTSLMEREGWLDLQPAIAKVGLTLFEEAVRRMGTASPSAVARLASEPPFAAAILDSRFRDYSAAGRLKLLLLRLRCFGMYVSLVRIAAKR